MNRPKNADLGKPSRDRRVPVLMTSDEYREIELAANRHGIPVSTYVRMKALEAARQAGSKPDAPQDQG